MTSNIEPLAEIRARKESKAMSGSKIAQAKRYTQKITQVRAEYKKLTGNDYGSDGYFVFRYEIYEGWIQDLEEPEGWRVESIAVDEQGDQFKAVGPEGAAWATRWKPIYLGAARGPGENKAPDSAPKAPEEQTVTESFQLDPATRETLVELADMLGKTQADILRMAIHDMGVEYNIVE